MDDLHDMQIRYDALWDEADAIRKVRDEWCAEYTKLRDSITCLSCGKKAGEHDDDCINFNGQFGYALQRKLPA
jgi:hypothetical protein